jgi:hypothetical protein
MGINRISLADEPATAGPPQCGAFTAVPAMLMSVMDAGLFQRQLYQWAFEQAQHAVQVRRTAARDLFAIMN